MKLSKSFSHRFVVEVEDGREYVLCAIGRIEHAHGEWLRYRCNPCSLTTAIAALPFVRVTQDDGEGFACEFREYRIHDVIKAGVEPVELRTSKA